jgi:hypothetical protein
VLSRDSGHWICVNAVRLPDALACDHGFRVGRLVEALARNGEAEYDRCLTDGLLQIAVRGVVVYDPPSGKEGQDL